MTGALGLKAVALALLILGFGSLIASTFYDSYVIAFIGLGLTFWGALLLFVMPTKYVRLEMLTAASSSSLSNLEELLTITDSNNGGIYLPPKLLSDYQSSLVFIPTNNKEILPNREEILKAKTPRISRGLVLTPPGLALSKLLEKEMRKPFTEMKLDELEKNLPTLLERMEITKNTNIRVRDAIIIVNVKNYVFKDLCLETEKLQRTHKIVGCPFSSALACALAKVMGKPVTIEKEEQSQDGTTTEIQYRLLEE